MQSRSGYHIRLSRITCNMVMEKRRKESVKEFTDWVNEFRTVNMCGFTSIEDTHIHCSEQLHEYYS